MQTIRLTLNTLQELFWLCFFACRTLNVNPREVAKEKIRNPNSHCTIFSLRQQQKEKKHERNAKSKTHT